MNGLKEVMVSIGKVDIGKFHLVRFDSLSAVLELSNGCGCRITIDTSKINKDFIIRLEGEML